MAGKQQKAPDTIVMPKPYTWRIYYLRTMRGSRQQERWCITWHTATDTFGEEDIIAVEKHLNNVSQIQGVVYGSNCVVDAMPLPFLHHPKVEYATAEMEAPPADQSWLHVGPSTHTA